MTDAITRLDFVLGGVLRVVFYRSLHVVSVPFSPEQVLEYAQENGNGQGRFKGQVIRAYDGLFGALWIWTDVRMGDSDDSPTMNVWFFGAKHGAQTVLVRTNWWLGNFSSKSLNPLAQALQ